MLMYYAVDYSIIERLKTWLYCDLVTEYLWTPLLSKSTVLLIYIKKLSENSTSFLV